MGYGPFYNLSVTAKNKPLTMSSSNVQSIDHPMNYGLTVLDETIEWLLNICPTIYCGQVVDSNNWLKGSRVHVFNMSAAGVRNTHTLKSCIELLFLHFATA